MRRVYIVLSTAGVGGAEKRFTDNWHAVRSQGRDVHLVMDSEAFEGLVKQPGYAAKLQPCPQLHVRPLGGHVFREFAKACWDFFATQPRGGIVHFPLAYAPGLGLRFGHRVVVSWVNSALPRLDRSQWKNATGAWLGFFAADHVDVLNPDNLRRIRKVPGLAAKTSLTAGGTQIDPALYRPLEKTGDFVFLGRTEAEKQSLRFVEALPEVDRILKAAGGRGYRFVVCGSGREEAAIRALLQTQPFASLPVEFGYSSNPERVLGRAAVFFSLQRTSNYPSKALAEAMACGAWPILTEVGESSLMVEGGAHFRFVPKAFSAEDLARALLEYLALSDAQREAIVRENAAFAAARFAPGQQARYFADMYRRLGAA